MPAVKIRAARPEDVNALAEIYSSEDVVAYTTQLPFRDARFWQEFYKLRDPDGVELVAERDGTPVGHLGMILNRAPRRKHVATFGICVHPGAQRSGVGQALMSEMLNMADNWLHILRLELSVASTNEKAIALYEKFDSHRSACPVSTFSHAAAMPTRSTWCGSILPGTKRAASSESP